MDDDGKQPAQQVPDGVRTQDEYIVIAEKQWQVNFDANNKSQSVFSEKTADALREILWKIDVLRKDPESAARHGYTMQSLEKDYQDLRDELKGVKEGMSLPTFENLKGRWKYDEEADSQISVSTSHSRKTGPRKPLVTLDSFWKLHVDTYNRLHDLKPTLTKKQLFEDVQKDIKQKYYAPGGEFGRLMFVNNDVQQPKAASVVERAVSAPPRQAALTAANGNSFGGGLGQFMPSLNPQTVNLLQFVQSGPVTNNIVRGQSGNALGGVMQQEDNIGERLNGLGISDENVAPAVRPGVDDQLVPLRQGQQYELAAPSRARVLGGNGAEAQGHAARLAAPVLAGFLGGGRPNGHLVPPAQSLPGDFINAGGFSNGPVPRDGADGHLVPPTQLLPTDPINTGEFPNGPAPRDGADGHLVPPAQLLPEEPINAGGFSNGPAPRDGAEARGRAGDADAPGAEVPPFGNAGGQPYFFIRQEIHQDERQYQYQYDLRDQSQYHDHRQFDQSDRRQFDHCDQHQDHSVTNNYQGLVAPVPGADAHAAAPVAAVPDVAAPADAEGSAGPSIAVVDGQAWFHDCKSLFCVPLPARHTPEGCSTVTLLEEESCLEYTIGGRSTRGKIPVSATAEKWWCGHCVARGKICRSHQF